MRKVLTPEMEKYFIENALKYSTRELAKHQGVSRETVKRAFLKNNIVVPKEVQRRFKSKALQRPFSAFEDDYIIKFIRVKSIKTIATELKRSAPTISRRCKELNLMDILNKKALASRIKKGNIPFNKGKNQHEYMSAEAIERTKATRFKKGNIPPQTLPEGSEVLRRNPQKGDYYMIKVPGKSNLVYKHIWIWEQKNGKVPKGYNVVFKNGNSLDCHIENLECISNAELMRRNSLHNYPPELKNLIHLKGVISRQINKHKIKHNDNRTKTKN